MPTMLPEFKKPGARTKSRACLFILPGVPVLPCIPGLSKL